MECRDIKPEEHFAAALVKHGGYVVEYEKPCTHHVHVAQFLPEATPDKIVAYMRLEKPGSVIRRILRVVRDSSS